MERQRLRAILQSGTNTTLDCRPRYRAAKQHGDAPLYFFEQKPLHDVILIKQLNAARRPGFDSFEPISTLLYFPSVPENPGSGGRTVAFSPVTFAHEYRGSHDAPGLSPGAFERDLAKLEILHSLPAFAPFLVKDAMERAKITCDASFFAIQDEQANAIRGRIKQRLMTLAAKVLNVPLSGSHGEQMERLVNDLWALDSLNSVGDISRALQLQESETLEALYAWIGISYFETEFAQREQQMLTWAQWLIHSETKNLPPLFAERNEYLLKLVAVRSKSKAIWRDCSNALAHYNDSMACLTDTGAGLEPFAAFLKTARREFWHIGELILLMDQCMGAFSAFQLSGAQTARSFDTMKTAISLQHAILSGYQPA